MKPLLCALCLVLSACASIPRITFGKASVQGVKDAGKPATLSSGETRSGVAIPANTPVKITKIEAIPATDKTAFQPAREEVDFVPSLDTKLESVSTSMHADTGTVDQTVALHRIDAAESRILLYASLGCVLVATLLYYIHYPTPALCALAASVVFFMAWKLSGLPDWFWAIGLAAIVGGVMLWRGHVRGETDGIKAVAESGADPIAKNPISTVAAQAIASNLP